MHNSGSYQRRKVSCMSFLFVVAPVVLHPLFCSWRLYMSSPLLQTLQLFPFVCCQDHPAVSLLIDAYPSCLAASELSLSSPSTDNPPWTHPCSLSLPLSTAQYIPEVLPHWRTTVYEPHSHGKDSNRVQSMRMGVLLYRGPSVRHDLGVYRGVPNHTEVFCTKKGPLIKFFWHLFNLRPSFSSGVVHSRMSTWTPQEKEGVYWKDAERM